MSRAPAPGFAPAKINLCLHVTGRRPDGYHLLDSLVAFTPQAGDLLHADADPGAPPGTLRLSLAGPEAPALADDPDNLVLRAARAFGPGLPALHLRLDKHLPVASGIGGGSADAAAALRLCAARWGRPLPGPAAVVALGADVPVCVLSRAARMRGIGEVLDPLAAPLPPVWAVLANPRRPLATPAVFRALAAQAPPASAPLPEPFPVWPDARALARWLDRQRNDLEAPARQIEPAVSDVVAALAARPGCLLARMSGSGATCFGLFGTDQRAQAAAAALARARPDWWVAASGLI